MVLELIEQRGGQKMYSAILLRSQRSVASQAVHISINLKKVHYEGVIPWGFLISSVLSWLRGSLALNRLLKDLSFCPLSLYRILKGLKLRFMFNYVKRELNKVQN